MTEPQTDGHSLIVELRKQGLSYRQIQAQVHVSDRTIARALAAAGMQTQLPRAEHLAAQIERESREAQVRKIGAMLADLLPEGGRVEAKNPAMICQEVDRAVCPYARVVVWLDARDPHDFIDGATFCCNDCEGGHCETKPSPSREGAFRRYVAGRIRERDVIAKQDAAVARKRYRMELAGELFDREVRPL